MPNPWDGLEGASAAQYSGSAPSPRSDSEPKPWEGLVERGTVENPAPASDLSPSAQVAIDFSNQGPAAGQRTTPIISSHMPNLLSTDVHEDDAGNAWFRDRGTGELVQADKAKHVILTDPQDNTLKAFARTPQTDEGVLSGMGRLLGMGMGAGNIQMAKGVQSAITPTAKILGMGFGGTSPQNVEAATGALGAAERLGVNVPKAIATDSPITTLTGQALVKAPGGGPLQEAVKSSVGELQGSVGEAARKAGGTVDPAVAGDNFSTAVEKVFKPKVKAGIDAAYDNLETIMNPATKTSLDKTREAAQTIASQRAAAALEGEGEAVKFVYEAITQPGLTFKGIKDLRSRVGAMLDKGVFPEGMDEGELRFIYKSLSGDLTEAARASGGERGVAGLARVNQLAANLADWKAGLTKVLGPDTRSGEGVAQTIIRMAGTGAGADLETLAKARNAVPKEAWNDIASTAINQLGRARNGDWTPAAFASDFKNLSERGRALLFKSAGAGDVLPHLNDIAEVSQKFIDAGKLANFSGTAGHGGLYAAGAAVLGGIATMSFIPPLIAIGGIVGANGMARLLAQPATAAAVARWSKVYHAAVTSGSPAAKVVLDDATKRLANVAGQAGVTLSPSELIKTIQQPPQGDNGGQ